MPSLPTFCFLLFKLLRQKGRHNVNFVVGMEVFDFLDEAHGVAAFMANTHYKQEDYSKNKESQRPKDPKNVALESRCRKKTLVGFA